MRHTKAWLVAALCLWITPARAAISIANVYPINGISTTINLPAGHLLYVVVNVLGSSAAGVTVSDTAGNTFTAIQNYGQCSSNNASAKDFYAKNTTSNASDTITASSGGQMTVVDMAGADTSSPLDQFNSACLGSTNNPSLSTSGSTAVASEAVMANITQAFAFGTCTPDAAYTDQQNTCNSGGSALPPMDFATKIVSSTGTQSYTWQAAPGQPWSVGIATFKASASTPAANKLLFQSIP